MSSYYADVQAGCAYCPEHAPTGTTPVQEGHVYMGTLAYPTATVLTCDECGVELWNAEKEFHKEVSA